MRTARPSHIAQPLYGIDVETLFLVPASDQGTDGVARESGWWPGSAGNIGATQEKRECQHVVCSAGN